MIDCTKRCVFCTTPYIFYLLGGIIMRIVLDTDKREITVPWNYQDKLNEINKVIVDATHDESKKKTFTGYIDEIWKEAIADSDKGVKTGKKPVKKEKK